MKPHVDLQSYSKRLQSRIYTLEVEKQDFRNNLDDLRSQVTKLEAVHVKVMEELIRLQHENADLKQELSEKEFPRD